MIVKGTILSTERVPIRGIDVLAPAREIAGLSPPPMPQPVLVEETVPQVDFDAVALWLDGQNGAMRERLARLLIEDLQELRASAAAEAAERARSEAIARVKTETTSALAALARATEAAEVAFERELQMLADQCTEIVAQALTHIAGPVLVSREATLGVVTALLARLKDEREIVIRTSEADLAYLQSEMTALRAAAAGHDVSLVADRRVTLGGCIVETKLGSLDGRLETQLAGLFETIRAARGEREEAQ